MRKAIIDIFSMRFFMTQIWSFLTQFCENVENQCKNVFKSILDVFTLILDVRELIFVKIYRINIDFNILVKKEQILDCQKILVKRTKFWSKKSHRFVVYSVSSLQGFASQSLPLTCNVIGICLPN